MRLPLFALLASTLALGACGSLNPFNWGSNDAPPTSDATAISPTNPLIPTSTGLFSRKPPEIIQYAGTPVAQVTELVIERTPGGVIVRAKGVAQTPGAFLAQLTPVTEGEEPIDGVLTYRLEAIKPPATRNPPPPITQELTVARALTRQQLVQVNTIRVESATNALVSRR